MGTLSHRHRAILVILIVAAAFAGARALRVDERSPALTAHLPRMDFGRATRR